MKKETVEYWCDGCGKRLSRREVTQVFHQRLGVGATFEGADELNTRHYCDLCFEAIKAMLGKTRAGD